MVGQQTGLRDGLPAVRISECARIICVFSKISRKALGLVSFLFFGYRLSFPGGELLGREAVHSPTASAKVKVEGS